MTPKAMNADEKRWRAESDADAMARVEEIMSDASRKKMALEVARQRAADLTKRANVMSRVAGGKSTATKPSPSKPKKK